METEEYLSKIQAIGVPDFSKIPKNGYRDVGLSLYAKLVDYVPNAKPIYLRYKNHEKVNSLWVEYQFYNYTSPENVINVLNTL